MKKLINWFFSHPPARGDSLDFATAFLRIFAGLAMIPYGVGKIENYDTLKTSFFGDPVGLGDEPSLILCIFQQIFCAGMLVLGIQSRFAAFMLFTNMAVAVKFHFFDPFCAVKALPTLFLAIYAFLVVSGGGAMSVDNLLSKRGESGAVAALKKLCMIAAFALSACLWGGVFGTDAKLCAALAAAAFALFCAAVFVPSKR